MTSKSQAGEWKLEKRPCWTNLDHRCNNQYNAVVDPEYGSHIHMWKCTKCKKEAPDEIKVQWELLSG